MKDINILYTIDKKYIDMMLGSILSLILNNNFEKINVHIITSGFELDDYNKIDNVLKKYSNIELSFYDLESFGIEKYNIPDWRGTQIANARLFFQEILDSNLHKIENLLYLDSDTIVVGDIKGLCKYTSKAICAVKDAIDIEYLKNNKLENYVNSGVLFININEWIRNEHQEKIIRYIESGNIECNYPDQDILNFSLQYDIKLLPLKYNLGSNCYLFSSYFLQKYFSKRNVKFEEIEEAKSDPKILHSTGLLGIKPWMKNNINPFNDEFMKYIYMANPEFEKVEISMLKRILSASPLLFKTLFLSKELFPDNVKKLSRKIQ